MKKKRKKKTSSVKKRRMKRIRIALSSILTPYDDNPKVKPLNPKNNPYPLIIERRKSSIDGKPLIHLADGNHRASGMKKWAKQKGVEANLEVIDRNGASYKEVGKLLKKFQS